MVKSHLGFKGYFDLYNIPFQHIHEYDFTEKKSPLQPGGMNSGTNIFDALKKQGVSHFVSNPDKTEEQNRDALLDRVKAGDIDFAFMYWAGLDGLLHRVGNDSPEVPAKLKVYEEWIAQILSSGHDTYDDIKLYVFSDHGMANCDEHLDLKARIEALPLAYGKDYSVVYDSTMARFWFFNDRARRQIMDSLAQVPQGRILPDDELKQLRAHFDDHQFGELIFLVKEGVLIVPSHMGERPIRAMHGYHPHDPHSYATLFTNQHELPAEVTHIPHIHRLMEHAISA
jgi:predicted AlkP superfamily pyrophosphatase or phosphodiesterase